MQSGSICRKEEGRLLHVHIFACFWKDKQRNSTGSTVGYGGKGDRCDRLLTRGESIDIVAFPFKNIFE
jgi:hypothetical protein